MHAQSHHAAQQAPALPTNRAFVVQFRALADAAASPWVGRVEHYVSGHATHFTSWEQLQEFLTRLLMAAAEKPPSYQEPGVRNRAPHFGCLSSGVTGKMRSVDDA